MAARGNIATHAYRANRTSKCNSAALAMDASRIRKVTDAKTPKPWRVDRERMMRLGGAPPPSKR